MSPKAAPATGCGVKAAGVLGASSSRAFSWLALFSTRADRRVVRAARSPAWPAHPRRPQVASPPTVVDPPAPMGRPADAGSVGLVPPHRARGFRERAGGPAASAGRAAHAPHACRSAAEATVRPVACGGVTACGGVGHDRRAPVSTRGRRADGPAPSRGTGSATRRARNPTAGEGQRAEHHLPASSSRPAGRPLTNAAGVASRLDAGRPRPEGTARLDLHARNLRGSVEVGVRTPGNLRVRVAHGGKSFDIAHSVAKTDRSHRHDFRAGVRRPERPAPVEPLVTSVIAQLRC